MTRNMKEQWELGPVYSCEFESRGHPVPSESEA